MELMITGLEREEKREEYRTPKRWILSRLEGKKYGSVEFCNGHGKGVPVVTLEYLGWRYGTGRKVAVIHMGRILSKINDQVELPAPDQKS